MENFEWGEMNEWYIETIKGEIFIDNVYEKINKVKEDDIVCDFGASIGPFSFTLKDRKIKHVYCVEPSSELIPTLEKNLKNLPHTIIKKGIGKDNKNLDTFIFTPRGEKNTNLETISFKNFLDENQIEKIDFLKTDCEGGEYDIFNVENLVWLKENMKFATGEWHLHTPHYKDKFREFRDVFLRIFPNHHIFSVDGIDIKWDLWNEHFLEYYTEVIIHIDNRS